MSEWGCEMSFLRVAFAEDAAACALPVLWRAPRCAPTDAFDSRCKHIELKHHLIRTSRSQSQCPPMDLDSRANVRHSHQKRWHQGC